MKLSVYQLEHSPFCIPITQALTALGVPHRPINVSNADRSKIIKLTNGKYYQVPLLKDGSRLVYETNGGSQDIARYIDQKYAKGRLFPKPLEGYQTILIDYIENQVESTTFKLVDPKYLKSISDVVEKTMIIRHKERKFGKGCIETWAANARALQKEAEQLLRPFNEILKNSPYLLGYAPVYCDFLLYGILGNFTYKNFNSIPSKLKDLKKWHHRLGIFEYK